ncbi:MAG: protein-methionine-sulfoxide reductase catalytic subunit MsrP [Rhodospirillaceae bacterium]|nr:MAG: protein-methionine-sulfoxide reductase catalytic subunit MsrP [Rhodospirillaceae bacterium]
MLIRIVKASAVRSSEITPKALYLDRRRFITGAGAIAGSLATGTRMAHAALAPPPGVNTRLSPITEGYRKLGDKDELSSYKAVTGYNNFYEFGTDKSDPAENAHTLTTKPWTVKVDGLCAKPGTLDLDDFLKSYPLEERIYRHRCVEGWSMVFPWVGFSLGDVVKRFEPLGSAKYVQFETLLRPSEMPGQRSSLILPWPYVEGLRLDEAMNPLATLAVGLYGEVLPNQNGAPIRLVLPWKYGFKSIKSIVRVTFTETQPKNTWQVYAPSEYGFYSNVNPTVDHPRWSQATERRIGEFLRRKTLMFNGYAEEVGQLYTGMDLVQNF